jgi:16S rRNA processing protein RimM
MNQEETFLLGSIAKLHGYKGEVSLFMDVTNPQEYADLDFLLLDVNGTLTPFFIEQKKFKNKGMVALKFQGIDNEDEAKKLVKKKAYLPISKLKELDEDRFYDHEVVGYQVEDAFKGNIGVIQQVIDLPSNPLLQVDYNGKEILIPIFDGLVQKVNRKKKILSITAPEGLIDLYLG